MNSDYIVMSGYWTQINDIMVSLYEMGYLCDDVDTMIDIIDKNQIDTTSFDFPDGSYAVFKQNFFNHKYDVVSHVMTNDDCTCLENDIKSGKVWLEE